MPQQIDVPGIGITDFPDGMTDDQIVGAIKKDANFRQQETLAKSSARWSVVESALGVAEQAVDVPGAAKALWQPVSESGKAWSRLFGGVASDIATPLAAGRFPSDMPATAAALQGEENPAKADLAAQSMTGNIAAGAKLGLLNAVEGLPMLALSMAGAAAGVPAPLAFGAPMAAESIEAGGSPVQAVTAGLTGAVIPGVMHATGKSAGGALANFVERGWLRGDSVIAQKALEAAAGQIAINGMMEALKIPEYAQMSPEERRGAIAQSVAGNLAFMVLDAPKFKRGVPSDTALILSKDAEHITAALLEHRPLDMMPPAQAYGVMLSPQSRAAVQDAVGRYVNGKPEIFNPTGWNQAAEGATAYPDATTDLKGGENTYAAKPETPGRPEEVRVTPPEEAAPAVKESLAVAPAPDGTPLPPGWWQRQQQPIPPQPAPKAWANVDARSAEIPTEETSPVDAAIMGGQRQTKPEPDWVKRLKGTLNDTPQPPDKTDETLQPKAPVAAPEPPMPPPAPDNPDPTSTIRSIIGSQETGQAKSVRIRKLAEQLGISVKDMQERIEAEIVTMTHEVASSTVGTPRQHYEWSVELYKRQPTLSARTSTSVADQAYSTPAPLAIALRHAVGTHTRTSVYEPTAGNGMLMVGSDLARSHGNEWSRTRAEALRRLGVKTVTEHDAAQHRPFEQFDAVMANPPFGSINNVNYGGYGIKRLEHLISLKALEALGDDGKGAIILGAKREEGRGGKGAQWVFENYLYGHYNVVGNFEVSGDLYSKQGASWPVRVIVVDGRKVQSIKGVLAPEAVDRFDNWDQVWSEADRIRNEIEARRESVGAGGQTGLPDHPQGEPAPAGESGGIPTPPGESAGAASGGGQRRGETVGVPTPEEQSPRGDAVQPPRRPLSKPEDEPNTDPGLVKPGKSTPRVEGGVRGGAKSPADGPGGTGGDSPGSKPRQLPRPPAVAGTEHQDVYPPHSKGNAFGTLSPKNIVNGMWGALDVIEKREGAIDTYVGNRLNMSPDELRTVMAAEQIDGVALAIDQIEKGGALIIGDETGIGKGRQAAGIIRYAILNGKIPVFFTKDPKLFTDMYGDLLDIHTEVKPFLMGDPGKASIVDGQGNKIHRSPAGPRQRAEMARIDSDGWAASGYDAIFATYSQINERNARQAFLEGLAAKHDTILIMDEAHEAAGDATTSMQAAFMMGGPIKRGKGEDQHTVVLPGLLNADGTKIGRGGVVYLSATYAKRSENIPVYFRTSLSKASDSFVKIVEAMKKGGVAMQQAVSEALAKAGQYIRRERDFTGVSYSMKRVTPADEAKLARDVDQVTDVLSAIVRFNQQMRVVAEGSTAQSEAATDMTDFASVVHNQVGQLLLAAKADAVVDEAIAAHKKGEKPVIALTNTMESFLGGYIDDNGVKPGEPIKARWNELLKYALERSLRTSTDLETGGTEIGRADPDAHGLGPVYARIIEAADAVESNFPISPIDYIIQKLERAGIKVVELTGRKSGIEYTDFATGAGIYRRFMKANKNAVVNRFNAGEADGILLNASGSTGLSIHASEKFADQKPRHMIIGQPALDINTFVQILGRIKRTGMVMNGKEPRWQPGQLGVDATLTGATRLGDDSQGTPYGAKYTHLVLPLQAELRPAAITSRKMKSLNANTTAESGGSIKIEAEDILNKYGDQVCAEYLFDHPKLQQATGLFVGVKEDGAIEAPEDFARKLTGRMALLPDSIQRAIYEEVIPAYKDRVEQMKATGEYDLEIAVHDDWDGRRTADDQLVAGTDESNIFTAGVRAQKWEVRDNRHVPTAAEMLKEFQKRTGGAEKLKARWEETRAGIERDLAGQRQKLEKEMEGASEVEQRRIQTALDWLKDVDKTWKTSQHWTDSMLGEAGKRVELTNIDTGDTYEGAMVDFKLPKSSTLISPRAFKLKFAVNSPGGVLHLSLQDFKGKWRIARSDQPLSEMTPRPAGSRYNRYFITGNPIRGFEATGGKGKMVRFRAQDKSVVTGLMMPNNWSMDKLAKDPRLDFASGDAAAHYLRNQRTSYRNPGTPIQAGAGRVQIMRSSGYDQNRYTISVPAAKSTGGAVYLNVFVRGITGDFTKRGNRMTAEVAVADLARTIDAISTVVQGKFRPVAKPEQAMGDVEAANKAAQAGSPTLAMVEEATLPRRINDESMPPPPTLTTPQSLSGIRDYIAKAFDVPIHKGGFRQQGQGIFKVMAESIRLKRINDVPALAHELGHYIHFAVLGDQTRLDAPTFAGAFDHELIPLGQPQSRPSSTPDRIRQEGVAEFTRLWLTDPVQALAQAPAFAQEFETRLANDFPVAYRAIQTARDMVTAYVNQDAGMKIRSRISRKDETPRMGWREWASRTADNWVNELAPLENAVKFFRNFGVPEQQAKLASDLAVNYLGGWRGKVDMSLYQRQIDLHGNDIGPSYREILSGVDDVVKFGDYLVGKAELEDIDKGLITGVKANEVASQRAWVANLNAAYGPRAQKMYTWQRNNLGLLVDSGVLSADSFNQIVNSRLFYVPFHRVMENLMGGAGGAKVGKGFIDLGPGVYRRRGSDRQIIDPLESAIKNAYLFRDLAERNLVAKTFVETAESVRGGARVAEHIAKRIETTKVDAATVLEHLTSLGIQVPNNVAMQDLAITMYHAAKNQSSQPNGIFTVWQDGKRQAYQVSDPHLYRALALMDRDIGQAWGKIFKPIRAMTGWFRAGATLNPEFIARNPGRDQWTAAVYSKHGFLPIVDGVRGIFSAIRRDDLYWQWVKSGGRYSDFIASDRADIQSKLADVIKEPTALNFALAMANPLRVVKNLQAFSEIMEQCTRISEFRRAKSDGASDVQAANDSKDVTLNFARGGFYGKLVNQINAFFNAGIQDISKFARAHQERPLETTAKALFYVSMPSIMAWYLGKDDKDYRDLPDWRRNFFWNINFGPLLDKFGLKMPGDIRMMSFPKPFLLGQVYGSSWERGLDLAYGKDPNAVRKWFHGMWQATPFSLDGVIPTVLKPIVETLSNHSFFRDRPLESQSMQNLPVSMRATPQTSETAKLVSRVGDMIPWDMGKISPIKVDNLVRGWFAGLGKYGTDATDYLIQRIAAGEVPVPPDKTIWERPVFKAFARSPYEASAYVDRYYNGLQSALERIAGIKGLAQNMETPEIKEFWDKNDKDLVFYLAMRGGKRNISNVTAVREKLGQVARAMTAVQASKTIDGATKRQNLITLGTMRDTLAEVGFKMLSPGDQRKAF